MDDFTPRNVGKPPSEIIPESASELDFAAAQAECETTVEKLTEDVSGIGPKAAERYLLRYEYGFSTKSLAEEYGVTSPTITNQASKVREKILKYPKLAQIVGGFRARRANLTKPLLIDPTPWNGSFNLQSANVSVNISISLGDFRVPYSWKFTLSAESNAEEMDRHLLVDYIVDADFGVLLKRSLKGISHSSWKQIPYFQQEWNYNVYPLPNRDIPNEHGTLIDALEYHTVFDVTNAFEKFDWSVLEAHANSDFSFGDSSARLSLPEVLLDLIRRENTVESIHDYSQHVHARDNIERLLRTYPTESPSQLPLETVKLLWNGELTRIDSQGTNANDLRAALETSRVTIKAGNRTTR